MKFKNLNEGYKLTQGDILGITPIPGFDYPEVFKWSADLTKYGEKVYNDEIDIEDIDDGRILADKFYFTGKFFKGWIKVFEDNYLNPINFSVEAVATVSSKNLDIFKKELAFIKSLTEDSIK